MWEGGNGIENVVMVTKIGYNGSGGIGFLDISTVDYTHKALKSAQTMSKNRGETSFLVEN